MVQSFISSAGMEPKDKSTRSAGILMHITSLPGPSFIGDIGPAAIEFAGFLNRSKQTVWQMLPIQPVHEDQGYSPYSCLSAMAGNPLLISPELLLAEGLIDCKDAEPEKGDPDKVDFENATIYKENILNIAWENWNDECSLKDKNEFENFCTTENYWLEDYALFVAIKDEQINKPWYEWPDGLRRKDAGILKSFEEVHAKKIGKIKWEQMIFSKQWKQLKAHCSALKIKLLGDVPIYVAHDSADVWSHPEIFTIAENGTMEKVAGVPPDLFNDDGQLWGLPLFNWEELKNQNYSWWVARIKKNLEYFDMLRLDHFRAFSSYWSVPAASSTAKDGAWKPGPGLDLFNRLNSELGNCTFVAEDLGEIDDAVYILRDQLQLPGMNVLQFAFGKEFPDTPYLPHRHIPNSVVYTGTHDNNTTVGWFKDIKEKEKENFISYTGLNLNQETICDYLCRMAYSSVSDTVILPMQDILSLDENSRMNMPASSNGNWKWRLKASLLTDHTAHKLASWCDVYERY
jgi:4-alpha-glucanotransferase